MFDHIGLRTKRYKTLESFYTRLLPTLGMDRLEKYPQAAGYGENGNPAFWVMASKKGPSSMHLALTARKRTDVDKFHKKAIKLGAKDNGAPGVRDDYGPNYYAAYIIDPDGNNVEAVCHRKK